MAAASSASLRFSPLSDNPLPKSHPFPAKKIQFLSHPLRSSFHLVLSQSAPLSNGINDDNNNNNGGFDGGGGSGGGGDADGGDNSRRSDSTNLIALLINGWRSRVAADPEFPFKVLMEELVGVSATAVGDRATRPNFGLGEVDFIVSTLVVSPIVNFIVVYLLAPTAASSSASLSSLPSYIFEPGPYSLGARIATFVYKGVIFAAVGFASGLAGTAISNGLVMLREGGKRDEMMGKKKKKGSKTVLNAATRAVHMGLSSNLGYQMLNAAEFLMARAMPAALFWVVEVVLWCLNNVASGKRDETMGKKKKKKKKGPMTVLNATTWAVHMGLSSNLRYQTLNATEFLMARAMPATLFRAVVVVLRCLNNVAGGMSFVVLKRMMGITEGGVRRGRS